MHFDVNSKWTEVGSFGKWEKSLKCFLLDFLFPYFYSIFSFELKIVGPSDGAAMTVGFKLDFLRSQIFPTAKISTNR